MIDWTDTQAAAYSKLNQAIEQKRGQMMLEEGRYFQPKLATMHPDTFIDLVRDLPPDIFRAGPAGPLVNGVLLVADANVPLGEIRLS